MEFPSLRRELYRTSLLDLPRRNLLIFSITSISFIGILILFGYAGYTHRQYMAHFDNIQYFVLIDGNYQTIGKMEKPEWAFNVYDDYGLLSILALLVFGITSLVQFGKLRECLSTDLCLLRLLEIIDARLGISFSGEPKKPTEVSRSKFKDGWYWDVATDRQLSMFQLQTDWLESESEDWQIWHERGRLLGYSSHLTLFVPRMKMDFFSMVRAKAKYLKTHSLENEEYPGHYEFYLEFVDSGIKSTQEDL